MGYRYFLFPPALIFSSMLTNGVFSELMLIWENSQEGNKNNDRNCKM